MKYEVDTNALNELPLSQKLKWQRTIELLDLVVAVTKLKEDDKSTWIKYRSVTHDKLTYFKIILHR